MKYLQILEKKVIERTEGIPYLIRWNLFGIGKDSKYFSIKLHKILRSDADNTHNHPWRYISIILKGGYVETASAYMVDKYKMKGWRNRFFCECNNMVLIRKFIRPGSIINRPPNWNHSLSVDQPCWTLVFTLRKVQTWGFFTPKGFINWKNFSKKDEC